MTVGLQKTLPTEDGQLEPDTPQDRASSFEPALVKKHQRQFTSMSDKEIFNFEQSGYGCFWANSQQAIIALADAGHYNLRRLDKEGARHA